MAAKKLSDSTKQRPPEDKIARLLALIVLKDIESPSEQAVILKSAGFEIAEIAEMLNVTQNAVSVALYQRRKKKSRKRSTR